MRVLFYEPNSSGHHFAYLARMIPGFLDLPIEIGLATTRAAIETEEFRLLLRPMADRIELVPRCRPLLRRRSLANSWRRCRDLACVSQQWNADHVVVMYADGIWQLLALARQCGIRLLPSKTTFEGYLFRGGFVYPDSHGSSSRWRKHLLRSLVRSGVFSRILVQDELLHEFCRTLPAGSTKTDLSPDPITLTDPRSTLSARKELGLDRTAPVVSCIGTASIRKGVDLAIRAVETRYNSSQTSPQPMLLIAGPHDEQIKSLLNNRIAANPDANKFIRSLDRFLSEDEMLLVAAASDLVLAPYPNHSGRSSIILWAAAAGKPVLAVNRGCIQHVVEKEGLGTTCNVRDIDEFATAMGQALQGSWTDEDVARVRAYANWHRVENYQDISSQLIRARLAQ